MPKERENEIVRKYGAVFVIGIGAPLSDGIPHDGRAADYDDWSTPNEEGYVGLNGDLLLWNPVLNSAFEVSSMGIRVDEAALERQLKMHGQEAKTVALFHQKLLSGALPCTIAVESDNRASACTCCVKHTSARSKAASGRNPCERSVPKPVSYWLNRSAITSLNKIETVNIVSIFYWLQSQSPHNKSAYHNHGSSEVCNPFTDPILSIGQISIEIRPFNPPYPRTAFSQDIRNIFESINRIRIFSGLYPFHIFPTPRQPVAPTKT